jgi:hypothetical protein
MSSSATVNHISNFKGRCRVCGQYLKKNTSKYCSSKCRGFPKQLSKYTGNFIINLKINRAILYINETTIILKITYKTDTGYYHFFRQPRGISKSTGGRLPVIDAAHQLFGKLVSKTIKPFAKVLVPGINDCYHIHKPKNLSYFADLNLNDGICKPDLRSQFYKFAKKLHPDKGGDINQFIALKNEYSRLFSEINQNKPIMIFGQKDAWLFLASERKWFPPVVV